ncbi:50S ribosomal protein L25/general stress protein Ctc [Acidiferrobacter sp.]|uniref:50S ribosomal protein L25/general stress protein Ctc n=1 Tax=Acidiferrobacter sp. TaxID=1872107 RepID=UPI00260ADE0E|nr:50S ribosomal protein L25/general stress protein Ctc [Acidiferrobacter sp.]
MSGKFELNAEMRSAKGTGASRRLRRAGKVPGILYGAGKDPVMLSFEHDPLWHHTRHEAFFTSILSIKVDGKIIDQAVLRDLHMHPYKPRVAHMDLQRVSATERLHLPVPLHFINQESAPGVKLQGGLVAHLVTEVDVSCLPSQLPEFLAVDVGNLHVGESIHLSNLAVPAGVTLTDLAHGNDLAVVTITVVRETVEVEEAAPVVEAAASAPETQAPKAEGK